jgi:hypothetical protein
MIGILEYPYGDAPYGIIEPLQLDGESQDVREIVHDPPYLLEHLAS